MQHPFVKGTVTRQAHVALPEGVVEEEFGRDGFYGPVSHLYRKHAPTAWTRIEGPLKPRAIDCRKLDGKKPDSRKSPSEQDERFADLSRTRLLHNADVALSFVANLPPMPFYFRNADAEELYFVHRGNGLLETDFGPLKFTVGDYLVIPRGTTYRLLPDTEDNAFLLIESASRLRQPERGLLGQHALYDPAMIETPEPAPSEEKDGDEREVRIQREGALTSVFYPFNPLDVVGWKGDLSVWKINIRDFRPVMSHRAHLAPSAHTTFTGEGFVICSFVPRPLESDPAAVRVPFYHRNIDYDEVLFYHDGEFFSRHGIDSGMITFHPQGIHHGPHPQAVAASRRKNETNEVAVMLDTRHPLAMTDEAHAAEWAEYPMSWRESAE